MSQEGHEVLTAGDAAVLCFLTQPPLFQDPIKGLGCASLKKKIVLQARPNLRYILCCRETRVAVQAVLSGNHSSKCPDPNTHVVIVPVLCVGLGHPT